MRSFDLICFDVDGTLVTHPQERIVWEILNLRFTGDDTVNRSRFRQYKSGEISYADWVALDVGDWVSAGATKAQILEAIRDLRLIEDARETLADLKRRGHKLAVISGTIDIVLETLFPEHPFDEVFTNKVFFDEAGLLCGWEPTPYDVDGKARALREIAGRAGVEVERCAFVGDSFNDVDVARIAGLSIALNPKCEELIEVSDVILRGESLKAILPYLVGGDRG